MTTPKLNQIRVYPIKGITDPDFLTEATARTNMRLMGDREWAFRIGSDDPSWARKNQFLQAMHYPMMASIGIETLLDNGNGIRLCSANWLCDHDGVWDFDVTAADLQIQVNHFANHIGYTGDRPVHFVQTAAGSAFTDKQEPYVSIGNLNTVRALAAMFNYWDDDAYKDNESGLQLDRFGINLWLDNLPAFAELHWLGKTVQIGDVQLRVDAPITRCPKINATPSTGERDINLLQDLIDWFRGHPSLPEGIPRKPILGMFATVTQGGELDAGTEVVLPA